MVPGARFDLAINASAYAVVGTTAAASVVVGECNDPIVACIWENALSPVSTGGNILPRWSRTEAVVFDPAVTRLDRAIDIGETATETP